MDRRIAVQPGIFAGRTTDLWVRFHDVPDEHADRIAVAATDWLRGLLVAGVDVADLQIKLADANARIAGLETEIARLQGENEGMERRFADAEAKITDLTKVASDLESDLRYFRQTDDAKADEIKRLTRRVRKLKSARFAVPPGSRVTIEVPGVVAACPPSETESNG